MDVVFLHHLDANRLEGTQPDMQGDLRRLDAAFTDALQDRGCEVQSGSRCSDRAGSPGIDGLVLLAIQRCVGAIDVGWKGNVADAPQNREKFRHRVKLQMALAKTHTAKKTLRDLESIRGTQIATRGMANPMMGW